MIKKTTTGDLLASFTKYFSNERDKSDIYEFGNFNIKLAYTSRGNPYHYGHKDILIILRNAGRNTTDIVHSAILSGWQVTNDSNQCNNAYAWKNPNGKKVGCVCHTILDKEKIKEY